MTIVISLQTVGIILVVAMLVTPAATAQLLTNRFSRLILVASAIGIVAPAVGLYISYWTNTASAALIVLVETAGFLLALLLGPRTGLLRRRRIAT
jgi:manganese transport system permease protein